ncbi:MAG: hypothetical protein ACJ0BT_03005 [Pseudohongiellaceae bacterium]
MNKIIVCSSILLIALGLSACQTSVSTSSPQASSSSSSSSSNSSSSSSSSSNSSSSGSSSSSPSTSAQTGSTSSSSIPSTVSKPSQPSSNNRSPGNSQDSTVDTNSEITHSSDGTDTMDGMEGVLPGSQPSSNMPESTASNSSRNGENGIDVRLPGLDPFPEGLPGTSTTSLEDIFGSSQQGTGTINSNSGAQGAGGATAGPGNINDSIVNDGSLGGGIGEQTDDPFGDLANGRNPPMTTADRQTALDARLNESIAVFDGMILTEREQAQDAANANSGNGGAGGENTNGAGGIGRNGNSDSPVVIATAPQSPSGTGRMPNMDSSREGSLITVIKTIFLLLLISPAAMMMMLLPANYVKQQ